MCARCNGRPGPKTWSDVEFNPYQQVEETPQSDMEEMLNMYKDMLEKEHEGLLLAMTREAHMKHEVVHALLLCACCCFLVFALTRRTGGEDETSDQTVPS